MNDPSTRVELSDFGLLMKMVFAAEDFGLNRSEARTVAEEALERENSLSESLDRVAAALAARVLEKTRQEC